MQTLKKLALASAALAVLSMHSAPSIAADSSLASQLQAARQEGSIWTAFALNRHLSPFKLGVVVHQGTATLSGSVENEVDRELAAQIAGDVDGITKVDNQLKVDDHLAEQMPARQSLAQRFDDATLTATIKSKLLWNTSTRDLHGSVATENGVVTLKGKAPTADAKLLAGSLASNTEGVYQVNNLISLGAADTSTTRAETAAKTTEDALSDAWITSKVKASLLYSRSLDGLTINVETHTGMVSLSGDVGSSEERTVALELARNIRGVRGVDADLLKVAIKPAL
jgi:osmotically-inducible protein OsmY